MEHNKEWKCISFKEKEVLEWGCIIQMRVLSILLIALLSSLFLDSILCT